MRSPASSTGALVLCATLAARENRRAFSIAVSESTGRLVGAIAGDGEAFVLFGACSPL